MDVVTLPESPPDGGLRRLWQAPVFVLGLVALLGAWCVRPHLSGGPGRCAAHGLTEARRELDDNRGDLNATADRLHRLLDRGALAPERVGEAHFLYGTALIRLAERTSPALAAEQWKDALEHLQEADKLGVPDGDRGKLDYRLAKAAFHTDGDPASVAERLAAAVPFADGEAEGWELLTQAYLRLTPPNVQAALDANERLRQIPPVKINDELLAAARLTGGELLLRLQRPEDARKVLELVRSEAPPAILTRARVLRAQSYEDEQKWDAAATLWQAALTDARDPLPQAALIRYHLGRCYRELDQPLNAAPPWEECVRSGAGDEAAAAALGLAEIHVQEGQDDKALERLEFALRNVRKPDEWSNQLLDRGRVCELFERCCAAARQANKFELALKLAGLFERVAPPARALVLTGDIGTDWANARQQAMSMKVPDKGTGEEQRAVRRLFVRAAEAYESAARQAPEAPEYGDRLWLATRRYLDAAEQARARALLEQLFELAPRPDARLGEGWFLLGESFRREAVAGGADGDLKTRAADAYKACSQYQTEYLYRARYRLAVFALERGDADEAVEALKQNLDQIPGRDDEVKERSRLALVHIYYDRKEYDTVVLRLEEVLDRLPAAREGTLARYELADSYRELADRKQKELNEGAYRDPLTRDRQTDRCTQLRASANADFEKLVKVVEDPDTAGQLDAVQTRNVYYFAALTAFQMGQYEKSLRAYERMRERYKKDNDYWTAFAGVVSSYSGLGDNNKVRLGVTEIWDNLKVMDEETRGKMADYVKKVEARLSQEQPQTQPRLQPQLPWRP
jgi:tetratricopeptide (TPR) repeat protein